MQERSSGCEFQINKREEQGDYMLKKIKISCFYAALAALWHSTIGWGDLFWVLPIGPWLIAWSLLNKELNIWNRFGSTLGIGLITSACAVLCQSLVDSATGNVIRMSWLIVPMGIEIIVIGALRKLDMQPWFKVLVVSVALAIIVGGVESGILSGFVKNSMNHRNLDLMKSEGLLIRYLFYPVFIYLPAFMIMFYLACRRDCLGVGKKIDYDQADRAA